MITGEYSKIKNFQKNLWIARFRIDENKKWIDTHIDGHSLPVAIIVIDIGQGGRW